MDKYQTIQAIINTLNTVTVKGKENFSALWGSMQALEQLTAALKQEDAAHQEEIDDYRNRLHKLNAEKSMNEATPDGDEILESMDRGE